MAGIKGEVYNLVWKDNAGKTHTDEVVLSKDRRVIDYTRAWVHAARVMSETMRAGEGSGGIDQLSGLLEKQHRGLLRYGDDMQVKSVKSGGVKAEQFELPGPVTSLGDMGMAGGAATGGGDAKSGGFWGGLLGGKVKQHETRQKNRVENKVDRAVDRTVDSAVDKTINSVIKGIFGR